MPKSKELKRIEALERLEKRYQREVEEGKLYYCCKLHRISKADRTLSEINHLRHILGYGMDYAAD